MPQSMCRNGTYYQYSIDGLAQARMHYAAPTIHQLTGLEVSQSTIIRAALEIYIEYLDSIPPGPPEDYPVWRLKTQLEAAQEGRKAPWQSFPTADLGLTPKPNFKALIVRYTPSSRELLAKLLSRPLRPRKP